jgi:hypothetical protein
MGMVSESDHSLPAQAIDGLHRQASGETKDSLSLRNGEVSCRLAL